MADTMQRRPFDTSGHAKATELMGQRVGGHEPLPHGVRGKQPVRNGRGPTLDPRGKVSLDQVRGGRAESEPAGTDATPSPGVR
jgi:hypothetical protein